MKQIEGVTRLDNNILHMWAMRVRMGTCTQSLTMFPEV